MKKKFNIKSIIIMLVIVYIGYILINQQITMKRQKVALRNYNVELQKISKENEKLQDEVKMSKTDKYIEKLAREVLGLIKEGETPVMDKEQK